MVSLDFESFFIKVHFDEPINIWINELFKSIRSIHGLNRKKITEMLSLTTKELIILFEMTFYTQVNGVAVGSSLKPSLANGFFCYHKAKPFNDC